MNPHLGAADLKQARRRRRGRWRLRRKRRGWRWRGVREKEKVGVEEKEEEEVVGREGRHSGEIFSLCLCDTICVYTSVYKYGYNVSYLQGW